MAFVIFLRVPLVFDKIKTELFLPGATVEPFGSFSSQLFSRWGDLDISIELPNGSYILVPAKKHKQMLLGDVLRALSRTGYILNNIMFYFVF